MECGSSGLTVAVGGCWRIHPNLNSMGYMSRVSPLSRGGRTVQTDINTSEDVTKVLNGEVDGVIPGYGQEAAHTGPPKQEPWSSRNPAPPTWHGLHSEEGKTYFDGLE